MRTVASSNESTRGKPRTRRIDRPNQFHCLPCERIRVNAYLKTARGKAAQKHANKRYYALVSQLGTAHSGRNNKLFQSVGFLHDFDRLLSALNEVPFDPPGRRNRPETPPARRDNLQE